MLVKTPRTLLFVLFLSVACGGTPVPGTGTAPGTVASITLSKATVHIDALGGSEVLTATPKDAAGDPVSGVNVAWSHATSVTTVDASGRITAVLNGVDTVRASVGTISAMAIVTVAQIPATLKIGSAPTSFSMVGASTQLTARLADGNNQTMPTPALSWQSSDPAVISVDDGGMAVTTGGGSATISVSAGSLTDQVTIQVIFVGPVGPAVQGGTVPCLGGSAAGFPCQGIDLVSYLPNGAIGVRSGEFINDIWGWTDPTSGREYVIVGRSDGVSFVDVTASETPRYLGFLPRTPGAFPSSWSDVKVYQNHAFIVADAAGQNGMQVFDLTQLRNPPPVPRTFTPIRTYTGIASAHNMVINEATGFAYATGSQSGGTTCGGGLHMINIQTPSAPTFAGCFAHPGTGRSGTGYTHDAQCVVYHGPDATYQGREICFSSNETHVSIADVTNKSNPVAITRVGYPNVAYTHQGWLSEDHAYLFVNDELDDAATVGTRTLVWDVTELDDPILVKQYLGPTEATDHNNYVVGNRLFASNYQFGIRVIDVGTPTNPTQIGYFDTAPQLSNSSGFGGSWSNYPYFASGIVVVTSRGEGLFVLRMQ